MTTSRASDSPPSAHVPRELAQLVEAMMAPAAGARPSLAAVRAVIERVRAALPATSAGALAVDVPRSAASSLDRLTASQVGAQPVLATPPSGAPTVPPPSGASTVPPPTVLPPSVPPPAVLPPSVLPPSVLSPAVPPPTAGVTSTPASAPMRASPITTPALQRASQTHAVTTVGVPPPPLRGGTAPERAMIDRPPPRESRLWIVIAVVLALGAGVALALVLVP